MKVKGIALSLVLFLLLLIITWAFAATGLAALQRQYLQWNYFSHVIMVVLAISAIVIARRSFNSFGFTLGRWRADLRIALVCLISAAGYIPSLIYPPIAENRPVTTLIIIAFALLTLALVLRAKDKTVAPQPGLTVILLAPFALSISSAVSSVGSGTIASTIIFQFIFAGFGEEIFFRGYIQTRINEDFGRRWSIKGVNFGPGLLIAAALFGVLHLLSPFNPLMGLFEVDVLWAQVHSSSACYLDLSERRPGPCSRPASPMAS
jgi:membrane protease YdiL (CAAX protease family)